ncbi:MAG: flagellar hook-associated protein FlgK [Lachnospiraceae bacterium]|nr:flagellar hook-associated protein FlgK [Lachnospiraceae bacterium]
MPSQFFGLYIAGSGLRAANAALNTTANNIANAQTVGYSRQQVTLQANKAIRTFATYGCAGAGVDAVSIDRVRDSFYDYKYWSNNCKYGEYTAKQYYMRTLEDYFNDDGTSGFRTIFNKLSSTLQGITTNSSSNDSKTEFIGAAKALTDYFNNMYGNLQELQKDLNLEIKQSVDHINSLAQQIAVLNNQINVVELSGKNMRANELRDQRDLLIDELSEVVDVETMEFPLTNDPNVESNAHRYIVRIAGGQTLVDGTSYKSLECVARDKNEKVNQTDADGLYDVKWSDGNSFSLTNAAMDGRLKGLVQLRDGNNGANFNGEVKSVTGDKVEIKVTDDFLKSMQDCTLSDNGGLINIGNVFYRYDSWEFDGTDTYTFTMSASNQPQVDAGCVGKDAKTETQIKYQGIPYYMQQMNSWIRGFAKTVNNIFTSGVDASGNKGCILFTGLMGNNENQYTEADLNGADSDKSSYYLLTAGNFCINSELLDDPSRLGTRTDSLVGVEECGKVQEMINMLTSREEFSFRNGTAGQLLEAILGDVSLNASDANIFYGTYGSLRNTIDNQRNSISGVDEDEEAVSLVKFQNSYTLASKMIQTLTEVYDQLILRTGV